jgi:hypothetical protein
MNVHSFTSSIVVWHTRAQYKLGPKVFEVLSEELDCNRYQRSLHSGRCQRHPAWQMPNAGGDGDNRSFRTLRSAEVEQMRYIIVCASLTLAVFSAVLDWVRPSPDSWICKQGLCRFDQIVTVMSSPQGVSTNFASLVTEDASNPFVWCTYADSVALNGEWDKASAAFIHATSLGPNMPPVLMRAANFDFTHDRLSDGLVLSNQILRTTDAFNEVLFSYLTHSGLRMEKIVGIAIPTAVSPAQSWLRWLGAWGSDAEVRETWFWMRQNRLVDKVSAVDLSWTLWRRQSFRTAQELWSDWLGSARGDNLSPELLLNRHFQNSPDGDPFDWSISAPASIRITHDQRLTIHFAGTDNASLVVQQFTGVKAGRYHFSAEIESKGLTTEQRPFFRIIDVVNPTRLNVSTRQIDDSQARGKIALDFVVPPETQALAIQLIRSESERFDNKIEGTLRVYEVSLVAASQRPN